jgi:transcriptional regulator GlxA family with amidase domain
VNGGYSSSAIQLLDLLQIAAVHIDEVRQGAGQGDELPATIACDVVSLTGTPAILTEGVTLVPSASVDTVKDQYDLVFVPALDYPGPTLFHARLASYRPLYPWLMQQWRGGAIVASICTGTFLLAEAGLLDRRVATTSWWLEKSFHRSYPAVRLDTSRDITESDRVVCGSTRGGWPQLIIELLEMVTSQQVAELTARSFLFERAPAGDASGREDPGGNDLVSNVQKWFVKNLSKRVRLSEIAESMMVSERTLIRHFKKKLGITPHAYLQQLRVDAAKTMLRESNLRIGKVAERVGYSDVAFFQRVFREHVGVSPTVFRKSAQKQV